MLTALELRDWKSFGAARGRVPLAPLTLLVGPNASGKSNLLDALKFLQGMALALPIDDVLRGRWDGGREVWPGIRGGAAEAARRPAREFTIESVWDGALSHEVSVNVAAPAAKIASEKLQDKKGTHFYTQPERGGLSANVRTGEGAKKSRKRSYRAESSVLAQFQPDDQLAERTIEAVMNFRQRLRELLFLEIQPRRMRDPSQLGPSIGLSGEHVAAAVHSLTPALRQSVVDWLSELCAPKVANLHTEIVKGVEEVYLFVEEEGGTRISARSLSDGTLRFLGTLVALLTASPGSVVLLEEPDVGLHPARIHLLAEFLETVTQTRQIQVIATSHSPVLLQHLSDGAFRSTIAFDRHGDGATVMHKVGDLPHVDQLMPPENRARLIATGWLERAA